MKRLLISMICLLTATLYGYAQLSSEDNNEKSPTINSFVGQWIPDKMGWHGTIDVMSKDGELYLYMDTEEGTKLFENVQINESEPSIKWSFEEEIMNGTWGLGIWKETNQKEILLDYHGITASCGVPTEVFKEGGIAKKVKRHWKYFASMKYDRMIVSYGCKSDFFSSSDELLFSKIEKYNQAITYIKDNTK